MQALTVEQFKDALPAKVKKSVNQELVDAVNAVLTEPELYEQFRDNLINYAGVMAEGKFQVGQYISAVKYVSFKLMGCTNIDAYTKTFPEKFVRFTNEGVAAKDIASYVTAYNKSKLVNLIYTQTMVPVAVLNQDIMQKAINTQCALMMDEDVSPKVRSDAANSLMTHLKMPDVAKIELDVKVKEDSSIKALREATQALVAKQREAIMAGAMTPEQVAHSRVAVLDDVSDATVK